MCAIAHSECAYANQLCIASLRETLCDEYAETGAMIRYEGPDQIPLLRRPGSIERMLTNLIENAIESPRD